MQTLELLKQTFPVGYFLQTLSGLEFTLYLVGMGLAFLLFSNPILRVLGFKKPLHYTDRGIPFVLGMAFAFVVIGVGRMASPLSLTNPETVAQVLDSNYTVTPVDYYEGEFRAYTFSAPVETKTVTVFDKQVSAPITPISFSIAAKDLKKLETNAKLNQLTLFTKLEQVK